ncbi:MAG: hypothetical protein ACOCQX_04230 [Candidatus Nanoarchaeia archaeon]
MGYEQLVQYIADNLKRGYSPETIREFLVRNNYPPQIVDQALAGARKAIQQRPPTLEEFVQEQLQKGLDKDSIRRYLYSYGYPPWQVERALNAQQEEVKVKHHVDVSAKTFAGLFILIFAVVGLSIFFFSGDEEVALLDYKLNVLDQEVKHGSELRYTHSFENIGGKTDYDVFVEYQVQSVDNDYETVYSFQETIGIDTLHTKTGTVKIKEDFEQGDYLLRAVVEYDDKEARAYDSFTVIEEESEPTCDDGIKNQGE